MRKRDLLLAGIVAVALTACAGAAADDPLDEGRAIYGRLCSSCHLPDGSGGALAPAMSEVLATFPSCSDQIRWIALGSEGWKSEIGPTYGAQQKTPERVMPGFGSGLTPEELAQVAAFERVRYGGADVEETLADCRGA